MRVLPHLFENNRRWAEARLREDPRFFERLAAEQRPKYLWIGCADSRVPANEIVGLGPGELFVHRNVANLVVPGDLNCMAVVQFAVQVLEVEHIIVCGHYRCGGVLAAMEGKSLGLIDRWLDHVREVYQNNRVLLESIPDAESRARRLCELNVGQQVANLCHSESVQGAWASGRKLAVHGWIYDLSSGLLRDLDLCVSGPGQIAEIYRGA
jgi:carbonic anhydrase